ncbi:S-adenosyl-L-methionine-dependent methyltransferase [Pavlovales sp. CCMP2436]|nr:S-adenosyl-L-methionine-dependent methyltransferase [Pavlovales sp. CCMP2436]
MPKREGKGAQPKQRPLEVVAAEYDAHFERQFGGRWPALRSALLSPVEHACLLNKYCTESAAPSLGDAEKVPLTLPCYRRRGQGFPPAQADATGLLAFHLLDAASLLAVEALGVTPGDNVLDVCAAPGGKAVAILQLLDLSHGQLSCNDSSANRCNRLRRVLGQTLPREHSFAVKVTQHDATVQSSFARLFNAILVDAPCSSDRYVLQNVDELLRWTHQTPAKNAHIQFKLLCSALQAARSPSVVVYTTSALDSCENDGVVAAVLKRFPERVRVRPTTQQPFGEPTPLGGWICLPDTADGWGPCYLCTLEVFDGHPGEQGGEADGESSEEDTSDSEGEHDRPRGHLSSILKSHKRGN